MERQWIKVMLSLPLQTQGFGNVILATVAQFYQPPRQTIAS
jgi:hypothetical protein